MQLQTEIVKGKFIKEEKGRFICKVLMEGIEQECYIPSSAKLGQYLKLEGKEVLLTLNKGTKNRTKYSVFAVKYYNKYIVLNLNIVNEILLEAISQKQIRTFVKLNNVYLERCVQGYKADLVNLGENITILENKTIIATRKATFFPNINSERFIRQLTKIEELLDLGIKVHYNLIALSPIVSRIIINEEQKVYKQLLLKCISKGMQIHGLKLEFTAENHIKVREKLKIEI